ncbi:hypothetical protein VSDG_10204 [Cytospora chrysosperma]|uniref:Uncharacterized protein n=1 Tax=Cytospora chrysosperma TaxID=252740 RepID=A0A423V7K9_CYTCH|nr:hypothetical protein VSDG_10204 [Valsa sordida]
MRVYDALANVSEMDKEVWMANTPGQGALQAKMGALQLANLKTFRFLDEKLGVERALLRDQDLAKSFSLAPVLRETSCSRTIYQYLGNRIYCN